MQEEDLGKVDFDFTIHTKHDLWDYEIAAISGSGVAAEAVNTSVVQWKVGSHYWIILPPVLAGTTLMFAILDNKDSDWQYNHKLAMERFGKVILGVKVAGAFFFSQAIVLQIWSAAGGDIFTWYARLAAPCAAVVLIFPYALLEEHKAISAHPKAPNCLTTCLKNPVSVKIFEVLSQGLGADACMSSIFALLVPFKILASTEVIIIASSVAGLNMLIELLPKHSNNKHVKGARWIAEIIRTIVKAGALGSAVIRLIFNIDAGLNADHEVHTTVAAVSGGLLALFMAPAVGYRMYTVCRQHPFKSKLKELPSVNSIEQNDDVRNQSSQRFFHTEKKQLLEPAVERVEEAPAENPRASRWCTIL